MPRPGRAELLAYGVCVVVVAVLGWRSLAGDDHAAAAREAVPDAARPAVTAPGPARAAAGALVHVVGAVRRPGVYTLPTGARVRDAIEEAGGATGRADLAGVNLAARVSDAQQVVVPRRAPAAAGAPAGPGAAPAATAAVAAPVNLNTATAEELDTLPGVGPATAAKILAFRQSSGGFRSVEDLAQVPGIGPKRLETLREAVRV